MVVPQLTFLLLVGFVGHTLALGRMQSVAIRGRLLCEGQPASGIKIKLMDHNMILSDDLLAQADSDLQGQFYLAGHRSEISTVKPEIRIYHSCNHIFEQCSEFTVPTDYVSSSQSPETVFDLGLVRLEAAVDSC